MKLLVLSIAIAGTVLPTQAQVTLSTAPIVAQETLEHGGGCRKSSPAGQCCHAGSKPYHCH